MEMSDVKLIISGMDTSIIMTLPSVLLKWTERGSQLNFQGFCKHYIKSHNKEGTFGAETSVNLANDHTFPGHLAKTLHSILIQLRNLFYQIIYCSYRIHKWVNIQHDSCNLAKIVSRMAMNSTTSPLKGEWMNVCIYSRRWLLHLQMVSSSVNCIEVS